MPTDLTVFFDYTCRYSYGLHTWLKALGPDGIDVTWRTLSLKEYKRLHSEPSAFGDRGLSSVSLLALALSHAARAGDFAAYHDRAFKELHSGRRVSREQLLAIGEAAGVPAASFLAERERWLAEVVDEHTLGVERWRALGTPTLVLDGSRAAYVRIVHRTWDDDPRPVWEALRSLALDHPEVMEIKRSV